MANRPAPDLNKLLRFLTGSSSRSGTRRRSRKKQATLGSTVLAVLLAAAIYIAQQQGWLNSNSPSATTPAPSPPAPTAPKTLASGADDLIKLHQQRAQDVLVEAVGTVVKGLPDDNDGSRHQRFLVEITDDLTIKLSHNIDLAPRVPAREGDILRFKGDYRWNDLGGVVHWTHHDPRNQREGGWIEYDGKRYE